MSKFGFDSDDEPQTPAQDDLASRIASFPRSVPKTAVDLKEVDAAAESHGFVSREAAPRRRRRMVPTEPKRQLSIMMPVSRFEQFVAYADRHRLTYEEVISRFLDRATD
jgi:hypothetical protein